MKLIPFLGFSGQTHDAMAFYAKALGGQVTSEMKYRDMPPSDGAPGCNEMPPETLDHVAHSQLGDVNQTFNSIFNTHECAEGNKLGDLTGHDLADGVGTCEGLPRIFLSGLQRQ